MPIKEINSLLGTNYKSKKEFENKVNWHRISQYQNLSEPFIREFENKVNWCGISQHQNLSEPFIREFENKVNWDWISSSQNLSEPFIREFKDEVDWGYISAYQNLSKPFIREFNLKIDEDNWLYKDAEFKKQAVIKTGLYECHEDYFIAYKAIRKDRCSFYNFQYQYLAGETYESNCDCTSNENSFGLSGWTMEKAKKYRNSGLIVKVRINYEDVGRIVHNDGKIRCFKQSFLE